MEKYISLKILLTHTHDFWLSGPIQKNPEIQNHFLGKYNMIDSNA